VPVPVAGLSDAAEIALGDHHACARRTDGTVACWGDDSEGQLGDGTGNSSPHLVNVANLAGVTQVAVGGNAGCALLADGTVACWGRGALGNGNWIGRAAPRPIEGLSNVSQIVMGYEHACARKRDATVVCWGSNKIGQVGDGTRETRLVPTAVR